MTSSSARPDTDGPSLAGTVVCALVLLLGHLVTGYVVILAHLLEPEGPWDHDAAAYAVVAGWTALVFCCVTALLTWVFVKARWLRRWWFAFPAVLAAAALLRLTVLAP